MGFDINQYASFYVTVHTLQIIIKLYFNYKRFIIKVNFNFELKQAFSYTIDDREFIQSYQEDNMGLRYLKFDC